MRALPETGAPARTAELLGAALAHDSADRHVQGTAVYIDDMPEPLGKRVSALEVRVTKLEKRRK